MDRKWMRLIKEGGDASIGSALVRLARQAASVHMAEAAREVAESSEAGTIGGTDTRLRSVAEWEAQLAAQAADGEDGR